MRKLTLLVSLAFLLSLTFITAAFAGTISVDGKTLAGVSPLTIGGRTMVPMRAIFEALGASVKYDASTKQVTAVKASTTVILTVGSRTAYINGSPKTIDVAAQSINGKLVVPVRFVGEALGASVKYANGNVTISTSGSPGSGTSGSNQAPADWDSTWENPKNSIEDRVNVVIGRQGSWTSADAAELDSIISALANLKGKIASVKPLNPEDGHGWISEMTTLCNNLKGAVNAIIIGDIDTHNYYNSLAGANLDRINGMQRMIPSTY